MRSNQENIFTCFTHHGGQQFGNDGASLPHFALFTVGKIWNDSDDIPGTGRPTGIYHNKQFHDGRINIPVKRKKEKKESNSARPFPNKVIKGKGLTWEYFVSQFVKRVLRTQYRLQIQIFNRCVTHLDTVWMMNTSLPRTDSWI